MLYLLCHTNTHSNAYETLDNYVKIITNEKLLCDCARRFCGLSQTQQHCWSQSAPDEHPTSCRRHIIIILWIRTAFPALTYHVQVLHINTDRWWWKMISLWTKKKQYNIHSKKPYGNTSKFTNKQLNRSISNVSVYVNAHRATLCVGKKCR